MIVNDNILHLNQTEDISLIMNEFENFDSPYNGLNLSCSYYDNEELINKFKNCKNLKYLGWNLGSLVSKFVEFKGYISFLAQNNVFFDVICIQEIYQINDTDLFKLDNYEFVHKGRSKSKGGGIGIFVHKRLKFKVMKEFSHFEENLFESLTVKIEYEAKKSVIITNLYRPNTPIPGTLPSEQLNGFIDKLANLQAELSTLKSDSYILSDLNLVLLDPSHI